MLVTIATPRSAHAGSTASHAIDEQRIVATVRIARLRLLREGNRALRQALEHEVIEPALRRELDRRLDAIAGIPCAAADADGLHSGNTPNSTHAAVIRTDAANSQGAVNR